MLLMKQLNQKTIKRIVLTSSMASVCGTRYEGHVYTEEDFNDTATLESSPYPFSKVSAELKAWELIKAAQKNNHSIELVTVNPGFVFGPCMSDRDDSTSVNFIKSMMDGSEKKVDRSAKFAVIDVRDVIDAHVKSMEDHEVKGRVLCCHSKSLFKTEIAEILSKKFPKYPVPTEVFGNEIYQGKYDNSKLVKLLGKLTPMDQCLEDMVNSFIELKMLEKK